MLGDVQNPPFLFFFLTTKRSAHNQDHEKWQEKIFMQTQGDVQIWIGTQNSPIILNIQAYF